MYIYRQSIFFIYLTITAVLVISDQLSKAYIAANYIYLYPVEINSWLNFTWINNSGAAFSLLSDMGGWQRWFLSTISFLASIYIIIYLSITEKNQKLLQIALTLILAGAVGNLIDRVVLGHVIDFISVHYNNKYFFPTFNIADTCISVGAVFLTVYWFTDCFSQKKRTKWRDIAK